VKKHLDIIVLKALKNGPLSGYAVISLVHREYGVLLGAGMVYNLLRSMEKKNFVRASRNRARYYFLNKKGEELLNTVCANRDRIRTIINRIF
jgi:DNA-binding PadR family transcriptional regulator